MHHTKDKGDLGVFKAQVDLCQQGFMILTPNTEHAPFDLVIYKDGIFKRVQVKYRSLSKKGTIDVAFKSYWSNKYGVHSKKSNMDDFDICCIYCPETNECYYICTYEITEINISLRINTPKHNHSSIKLAKDYRTIGTIV